MGFLRGENGANISSSGYTFRENALALAKGYFRAPYGNAHGISLDTDFFAGPVLLLLFGRAVLASSRKPIYPCKL